MDLKKIKLGKLNIIDLSIISIIILFAIIFTFSKLGNTEDVNSDEINTNVSSATFSYELFIKGLSKTSDGMFKVGDEVYDKVSNSYIGRISNLEVRDALGDLEKENGEIIKSPIPGKIDVKITIETEGSIKNGEYLAGNLIRIMVGSTKQIKTKYVMCTGTIISIGK